PTDSQKTASSTRAMITRSALKREFLRRLALIAGRVARDQLQRQLERAQLREGPLGGRFELQHELRLAPARGQERLEVELPRELARQPELRCGAAVLVAGDREAHTLLEQRLQLEGARGEGDLHDRRRRVGRRRG